jgi:hypothetical protein
MRARDAVEWLVADDLRRQHVLAALAQDLGMADAKEKFKRVFFARENPYLTTTSQSMDGLAGVVGRDGLVGVTKGVDTSRNEQLYDCGNDSILSHLGHK